MKNKAPDTRIPLEWNAKGNYWEFALINQEWAEFRGLLSSDESGYNVIDSKNYLGERRSNGEYHILWTGHNDERPQHVYGLVAIRPKKTGTWFGIPLPVIIPIITALATAVGTIAVQNFTDSPKCPPADKVCSENPGWVPSHEMKDCKANLAQFKSEKADLQVFKNKIQEQHDFVLKRPTQERVIFLLGNSHGLRLEAIKRMHSSDKSMRDIALQAEEMYMKAVLINEASAFAFTKGKSSGQEEALGLLGLGEPKILSGQDYENLRR